jgi:TPP-dependent pyruvate/acetoin dehydrogenase alpha subunit
MIRYPAFDPPEYNNWIPDPDVVAHYRSTIEGNEERHELIRALGPADLIGLYEGLVRNRLHDIMLKRWVRQGVISKAWLGTGEEAATIGPVRALRRNPAADGFSTDFVAPMIRNAGACHEMGMSVADMLRGYLGTEDSPTRGRDLHIGQLHSGVLAPISPVGEMVPVAAGVALGFKVKNEPRVVLTWVGDGSTKSGPFHEGMNFAAARGLPLIVIVQNNQVALGTRLDQYHRGSFLALMDAYGVEGWSFDGNNVLDAYAATKLAADLARVVEGRRQGPFLLVAETFRMGGHATHDEREARQTFPSELFEHWGKRDPIGLYETYLIEGTLDLESGRRVRRTESLRERNAAVLRRSEELITSEVEGAALEAQASLDRMPEPNSAAGGVYAETAGHPASVTAH